MTSYIKKHELLYSSQYGFRKGHSTQHTILDLVNDIRTNMNQRLLSCGVFIDLKKAFDTVDHDILLDKFNHYGFRWIINDWFFSYLKNRTQTTQVGHYTSDKAVVRCGVPQGSILGPLLFCYMPMISTDAVQTTLTFCVCGQKSERSWDNNQ